MSATHIRLFALSVCVFSQHARAGTALDVSNVTDFSSMDNAAGAAAPATWVEFQQSDFQAEVAKRHAQDAGASQGEGKTEQQVAGAAKGAAGALGGADEGQNKQLEPTRTSGGSEATGGVAGSGGGPSHEGPPRAAKAAGASSKAKASSQDTSEGISKVVAEHDAYGAAALISEKMQEGKAGETDAADKTEDCVGLDEKKRMPGLVYGTYDGCFAINILKARDYKADHCVDVVKGKYKYYTRGTTHAAGLFNNEQTCYPCYLSGGYPFKAGEAPVCVSDKSRTCKVCPDAKGSLVEVVGAIGKTSDERQELVLENARLQGEPAQQGSTQKSDDVKRQLESTLAELQDLRQNHEELKEELKRQAP